MLYLDSSALVKLVVPEPESTALAAALVEAGPMVSSVLAAVEVRRAAARIAVDETVPRRAEEVIARVDLLWLDADVLEAASRLAPPSLRTSDAIHVASAVGLGADLDALVAYDGRLQDAARGNGLTVLAPA